MREPNIHIVLRAKVWEDCRHGAYVVRAWGSHYCRVADAAAIAGLSEKGFLQALARRQARRRPWIREETR